MTDPTAQPAIWLRDNCACVDCRDPVSGQRFFGITDLDADLEVVDVTGSHRHVQRRARRPVRPGVGNR